MFSSIRKTKNQPTNLEEEYELLQRSILKTVIEHREDVLEKCVKHHAGHLLSQHRYGGLMADYRKERRKIQYLKEKL